MKNTDWKMSMRQLPNTILVFLFLLIISLPLVDRQLGLRWDSFISTEKRLLAVQPRFTWNSIVVFPRKYEEYFNDNFSFRTLLVKINSYLLRRAFGLSAIPDVVIGKDGWLYLTSKDYGNSLEDYMGLIDVDQGTLELIRINLEQRTKELQAKGIQFLVVVAPDKQSIYPDYLPDNWKRNKRYSTRLDQVVEYLKAKSTVQILDVRNALLKERKTAQFPLYKKTDSHWNYFGAFVAYQQIMASFSMMPLQKKDFQWQQQTAQSGDLAEMLAASDQYKEENDITFSPIVKSKVTFVETENAYGTSLESKRLVASNKDRLSTKLLVFHDSFGEGLFKFLSNHFGESVFINSNLFSMAIVEKEKPNVVVFELVERFSLSLSWKELK